MTAIAKQNISSLSSEINAELDDALDLLEKNLTRVEGELDLECSNLKDLVNQRNPAIQKQLDALGGSISELHTSLQDVRLKLRIAFLDSEELQEATKLRVLLQPAANSEGHLESGDQEMLSPQEAGRMRHDEKVTLGGIFRALFMADEPGQRYQPPKK